MNLASLAESFLNSHEFQLRNQQRGRPQLIEMVEGFRLYARPNDWPVGAHITQHRTYEPHVTRELLPLLKPGVIMLDIGANLGYFTLLAASRIGPTGKVIAFEPNPDNCNSIHLSLYANHLKNVVVYPFAVSDKEALLAIETHNSNSGVFETNANASEVLVQAVSLDHFLPPEERIDIIKIDIEGSEGRAWRGMEALIRRCRPVVFTEFFPELLRRHSGMEAESYLNNISAMGYHLYILSGKGRKTPASQSVTAILDAWNNLNNPLEGYLDLVAYPGAREDMANDE
jgi:FkbM family methyltransferase